jgi:hypothetical protein
VVPPDALSSVCSISADVVIPTVRDTSFVLASLGSPGYRSSYVLMGLAAQYRSLSFVHAKVGRERSLLTLPYDHTVWSDARHK